MTACAIAKFGFDKGRPLNPIYQASIISASAIGGNPEARLSHAAAKHHLIEDAMTLNRCFAIRTLILAGALFTGLGHITHASAQEYVLIDLKSRTITELGISDDGLSSANDINNAGQVSGWSGLSAETRRAFITGPDGIGMKNLGTLGGNSYSAGINDAGQVVGWFETAGGLDQAFVTGPGGVDMRNLGTLGSDWSYANDINNTGRVVGESTTVDGDYHAFITGPGGGGMRDLGTLGGVWSYGNGINNAGQVVGNSYTAEDDYHAFITGSGGGGMRDLGTLGGASSEANGINESGQVAGGSWTAENLSHAFITGPDGMGMKDLGTLGGDSSQAYGINDAGQVVGQSHTSQGGDFQAFITGTDGEGMANLNSLLDLPEGIILTRAIDINNQGQVLAYAVTAIPEPEIYALMLMGLGMIGFIARGKKAEMRLNRVRAKINRSKTDEIAFQSTH